MAIIWFWVVYWYLLKHCVFYVCTYNLSFYYYFWQGCKKGTADIGVFIAERWIDSVVDVARINEWIMYVKLVIGKQIVNKIVKHPYKTLKMLQFLVI